MSLTGNDRKVRLQAGISFPTGFESTPFAVAIAAALRTDFGSLPSSVKTVAQLTCANERAVRNWFEGKNGPNGENLVTLMRHSDAVLSTVLTIAGRQDLAVAIDLAELRRQLVHTLVAIDGLSHSGA